MIRTRLVTDATKTFLTLANDVFVGKSLSIYGEWSHGEVELLSCLLAKDANVVEVGSNIGAHTVFLAKDICPNGRVYAFEPRRVTFQILNANIALNGIDNVYAYNVGLSDAPAEFRERNFAKDGQVNVGGIALGEAEGCEERVVVSTLDHYISEIPKVSLLKLDVEGFEERALIGAQKLIARDRPTLYLENDRPEHSEALVNRIWAMKYEIWWHFVPLFRPNNRSATSANVFGDACSFNILCLPREKNPAVQGLLKLTDPKQHPLRRPQAAE